VVCSVSDPDTGPSGFSSWSWLGSFNTIASSAVAVFNYFNGIYSTLTSEAGLDVTSSDTTLTSKTLICSSKAKEVWGRGLFTAILAAGDDMFFSSTSAAANELNFCNAGSTTVTNADIIQPRIPIITPKTIWMRVTSASDTAVFRLLRWQEQLLEYK
jgi:hypothetical protein